MTRLISSNSDAIAGVKKESVKPKTAFPWKVIPLSIALLGIMAGFLAVFPHFSASAAIVSASMALCGMGAVVLTLHYKNWWSQIALVHIVMLFGLGISIRAGLDVFGGSIYWPLLLMGLYVLAWTLPIVAPTISGRILSEQFAPQTPVGRWWQAIWLGLLPGVGAFAYLVQRLRSERGFEKLDAFLIALIGSVVVIGASQAYSHQYWQKRPWAARGFSQDAEEQP